MAKHDETQQKPAAELAPYEERTLAKALSDLADAIRSQPRIGRPASGEAGRAAEKYLEIKSVLRTFLERAPDAPDYSGYSRSTGLKKR
jgi:hypothetical protein